MPDLRHIVLNELERRGWSRNQLAVSLRGKRDDGSDVPVATVQDWLSARTPSINSVYLGLIFDALDLTVTPSPPRPSKSAPAPSSPSRAPAKRPKKAP